MTIVARVASLIFNTPLLVLPETAATIASALADRFGVDAPDFDASRFVGAPAGPRDENGQIRQMYRMQDGVALISVLGELVNRGAWVGASSGLTSYEGIDAQLAASGADPNVRAVILDLNSPGGSASGAMETAGKVRALAAKKPVYAFVNGQAASAGYAIASGASKIVTTPSGVLGSIGVVWMHVDRSEQIAKAGLKPTIFKKGDYKDDGHGLGPISEGAGARIDAQMTAIYDLFVQTVATHRGLDPAAVRDTQAGVFMGQAAVDAGLADAVGALDDVFTMIAAELEKTAARSNLAAFGLAATRKGPRTMTDITLSQTDLDARLDAARAQGAASATTAASLAERQRVGAILGHAEAKGREATAQKLAFSTDMTAEAAAAFLADLPKAEAPAAPAAAAPAPRLVPVPNIQPDADPAAAAPANEFEAGALEAKRLLGKK